MAREDTVSAGESPAPMAGTRRGKGVDSVDRALGLLACFRDSDTSLTLADLASRSGLYKSTILRLANSLEAAGFLIRLRDKSFTIGPEVMRLGSIYQRSLRVEGLVRPILLRLLGTIGESASLFRQEGECRVCVFREDSEHSVRDTITEGQMLPLPQGAAGRILMEFNLDAVTAAEVAASGATIPRFSYGERDPDVAAAAVPVFWRRSGEVALLGALTVSGPVTRFTAEREQTIRAALLEEGARLSAQLGVPYESVGLASK